MTTNWGDNACLRSYLPSKQRIQPIMGTVNDNYCHIILLFLKCCWLPSIRQGCLLLHSLCYREWRRVQQWSISLCSITLITCHQMLMRLLTLGNWITVCQFFMVLELRWKNKHDHAPNSVYICSSILCWTFWQKHATEQSLTKSRKLTHVSLQFLLYNTCRLHLQRGEAILFQSEGYFHSESSESWHSEPCWNKTHADEIKHIH